MKPIREPDLIYHGVYFWWEEELVGNDEYAYPLNTKDWTYYCNVYDADQRWMPLMILWWWQDEGHFVKEIYARWFSKVIESRLLDESAT